MKELKMSDALETKCPEIENYKNIKPESDIMPDEARGYLDNVFENVKDFMSDIFPQGDDKENTMEKTVKEYIQDLKSKSEFPDTISDKLLDFSDIKMISPEKNGDMRKEFKEKKDSLIKQWKIKNGCSWPRYEQDVLSQNGNVIRCAGEAYDIHHKVPLCMGGKNEVDNISPLHANVHYDHCGVHATDSPLSKLMEMIKER